MRIDQTWGIIGTGWLGSALSEKLKKDGITFWGTTSKTFDWVHNEFPQIHCDILFLNTPPLISITPKSYVDKIPDGNFQKIIFISSIAVYGRNHGVITEDEIPEPVTQNGLWLYEVEQLLIHKFKSQVTILRSGGLIGENRHPSYSLSKQNRIVSDAPINLIHRNDLIQIILKASDPDKPYRFINTVTPFHPNKSDYYKLWTDKLKLTPIQFSSGTEKTKIVTSNVLPLIYPNWICPELNFL